MSSRSPLAAGVGALLTVLVLAGHALAAARYAPRFLFSFGSCGSGPGEFRSNYGLAIDKRNGWVYVTDTGVMDKSVTPHVNKHPGQNHRVEKFDLDGNFLMAFGEYGFGPGQFKRPLALAVDDEGAVYVSGEAGHRIQKFGLDGAFRLQWGTRGSGDGQFRNPYGIAVHDGHVFVVDRVNGNVQTFTTDGVFVEQFGRFGPPRKRLNLPVAIAVDATGGLFVADVKAAPGDPEGLVFSAIDRIVKFAPDHTVTRTWGTYGTGPGQFDYPRGIAIGARGNLFVSDRNNDRVQIFSPRGTYLGSFGTTGRGPGQFNHNRQLDIVGHRLYVADSNNCRVQVFDIRPLAP